MSRRVDDDLGRVDAEQDLLDIWRVPLLDVAVDIPPLQVERLGGDPAESAPAGILEIGDDTVLGGRERIVVIGSEDEIHPCGG